MAKTLIVKTRYIINGSGKKVAEVADKYPLQRCDEETLNQHVTLTQDGELNCTMRKITCEDAVYDQIVVDDDICIVPASEVNEDDTVIPAANEFGAWRSEIAKMKNLDNSPMFPGNKLRDILGSTVNNRNWKQLREVFNDYLKNMPAA